MITVEGVVRPRPVDAINKKMKTGFIEVSCFILSKNLGWFHFGFCYFQKCNHMHNFFINLKLLCA